MDLMSVINYINGKIWSTPMIFLCLGVGALYSIALRFPQIRCFKDMFHYLIKGSDSENGISSFQGFAMALGGRIGVGNIAGTATAICFGGPGAIFWMWIYAILGAGSAFGESVLAQIWKEEVNGEYSGGPAYYIGKGTKLKLLAILFAVFGIMSFGFTGPTIQAFNIAESVQNAFGISPYITGAVVAALFGIIVLGGMKRIGRFAELVVPVMAAAYILLTVVILGMNASAIPSMFGLIFSSAFNLNAMYGAVFGSTIMWGVKRGVYSTEAGMGSGAQAAAAAEVSHPVKQGLAQAFSVYIDTIIVCTATALMILSTGMYNVINENTGEIITNNIPDVAAGTGYTQAAIDTLSPGLGSVFIAIAIFFFALTTILSFGYYALPNITFLFGKNKHLKQLTIGIAVVQMLSIFLGSIRSSELAWALADIGVGSIAWVNLLGMLFLLKPVMAAQKDFERQKKLGLDPVFDPDECGIKEAGLWKTIRERHYKDFNKEKKGAS